MDQRARQQEADELQRRFPSLSLAEAYVVLERHGFNMDAAVREVQGAFSATAGDHGVMYEMPPSSGDGPMQSAIDDLFQQAKGKAAAGAAAGGGAQAFFGSGRRLGHTEMPSPSIRATVRQQRSVTVSVYANVIRVLGEDGKAATSIPMATEDARAFMDDLQQGVVPRALEALYPNCDVSVALEDRSNRDYAEEQQRFTAFQDEGRRLGATPAASAAAAAAGGSTNAGTFDPNRTFQFDPDAEATVVRLVNTAGKQSELRVNPTVHTVEDLYFLAHQAEPTCAKFTLEARDMPPRRLGPETRSQTVEEARLKRAVVVMRPL